MALLLKERLRLACQGQGDARHWRPRIGHGAVAHFDRREVEPGARFAGRAWLRPAAAWPDTCSFGRQQTMPTPNEIVLGLRLAANQAMAVAVVWHALTAALVVALVAGWRPSRRLAAMFLAAPIATVGVVALAFGNLFNGALFIALAVLLVGVSARLGSDRVRMAAPAVFAAGAAMVAFAWSYPHFLESRPPAVYFVAAPMGVIPCPTLSLVIGFTLLFGGLGSRAWSVALVAAGAFYGLFGVARLGVWLDVALVAGAGALLAVTLLMPGRARATTRALKRSGARGVAGHTRLVRPGAGAGVGEHGE
jgi:hypothetical protein